MSEKRRSDTRKSKENRRPLRKRFRKTKTISSAPNPILQGSTTEGISFGLKNYIFNQSSRSSASSANTPKVIFLIDSSKNKFFSETFANFLFNSSTLTFEKGNKITYGQTEFNISTTVDMKPLFLAIKGNEKTTDASGAESQKVDISTLTNPTQFQKWEKTQPPAYLTTASTRKNTPANNISNGILCDNINALVNFLFHEGNLIDINRIKYKIKQSKWNQYECNTNPSSLDYKPEYSKYLKQKFYLQENTRQLSKIREEIKSLQTKLDKTNSNYYSNIGVQLEINNKEAFELYISIEMIYTEWINVKRPLYLPDSDPNLEDIPMFTFNDLKSPIDETADLNTQEIDSFITGILNLLRQMYASLYYFTQMTLQTFNIFNEQKKKIYEKIQLKEISRQLESIYTVKPGEKPNEIQYTRLYPTSTGYNRDSSLREIREFIEKEQHLPVILGTFLIFDILITGNKYFKMYTDKSKRKLLYVTENMVQKIINLFNFPTSDLTYIEVMRELLEIYPETTTTTESVSFSERPYHDRLRNAFGIFSYLSYFSSCFTSFQKHIESLKSFDAGLLQNIYANLGKRNQSRSITSEKAEREQIELKDNMRSLQENVRNLYQQMILVLQRSLTMFISSSVNLHEIVSQPNWMLQTHLMVGYNFQVVNYSTKVNFKTLTLKTIDRQVTLEKERKTLVKPLVLSFEAKRTTSTKTKEAPTSTESPATATGNPTSTATEPTGPPTVTPTPSSATGNPTASATETTPGNPTSTATEPTPGNPTATATEPTPAPATGNPTATATGNPTVTPTPAPATGNPTATATNPATPTVLNPPPPNQVDTTPNRFGNTGPVSGGVGAFDTFRSSVSSAIPQNKEIDNIEAEFLKQPNPWILPPMQIDNLCFNKNVRMTQVLKSNNTLETTFLYLKAVNAGGIEEKTSKSPDTESHPETTETGPLKGGVLGKKDKKLQGEEDEDEDEDEDEEDNEELVNKFFDFFDHTYGTNIQPGDLNSETLRLDLERGSTDFHFNTDEITYLMEQMKDIFESEGMDGKSTETKMDTSNSGEDTLKSSIILSNNDIEKLYKTHCNGMNILYLVNNLTEEETYRLEFLLSKKQKNDQENKPQEIKNCYLILQEGSGCYVYYNVTFTPNDQIKDLDNLTRSECITILKPNGEMSSLQRSNLNNGNLYYVKVDLTVYYSSENRLEEFRQQCDEKKSSLSRAYKKLRTYSQNNVFFSKPDYSGLISSVGNLKNFFNDSRTSTMATSTEADTKKKDIGATRLSMKPSSSTDDIESIEEKPQNYFTNFFKNFFTPSDSDEGFGILSKESNSWEDHDSDDGSVDEFGDDFDMNSSSSRKTTPTTKASSVSTLSRSPLNFLSPTNTKPKEAKGADNTGSSASATNRSKPQPSKNKVLSTVSSPFEFSHTTQDEDEDEVSPTGTSSTVQPGITPPKQSWYQRLSKTLSNRLPNLFNLTRKAQPNQNYSDEGVLFNPLQQSLPLSSTPGLNDLTIVSFPRLKNCGNSCYINSVMQALAHTPDFVNLIQGEKNPVISVDKNNALDQFIEFINTMGTSSLPTNNVIIDTEAVYVSLAAEINTQAGTTVIYSGVQESASQYITHLFENFLKHVLKPFPDMDKYRKDYMRGILKSNDISTAFVQFFNQDAFWKPPTFLQLQFSVCDVHFLFRADNTMSFEFNPNYILIVNRENKMPDLYSCLRHKFSNTEQIMITNPITDTYKIYRLPEDILMITVTQTVENRENNRFIVPEELDMTPYMIYQTRNYRYILYGVIYHDGNSAGGGHYYTIIRMGDFWLKFNDANPPTFFRIAYDQGTKNISDGRITKGDIFLYKRLPDTKELGILHRFKNKLDIDHQKASDNVSTLTGSSNYPYVNSILQVLRHTVKFIYIIHDYKNERQLKDDENTIRKDFQEVFNLLFLEEDITLDTTAFSERLMQQMPRIDNPSNQDSVNFLNRLFAYLQPVLKPKQINYFTTKMNQTKVLQSLGITQNSYPFFNPYTMLQSYFGISTMKPTFDSFYTLSLERNHETNLKDCLDDFGKFFYQIHDIFIITLQKEDDFLEWENGEDFQFFVPGVLHLNNHLLNPNENSNENYYALYAVITRLPENTYVASILLEGTWYRFSDTEAGPEDVSFDLNFDEHGNIKNLEIMKGSIFFYQRVPVETVVSPKPLKKKIPSKISQKTFDRTNEELPISKKTNLKTPMPSTSSTQPQTKKRVHFQGGGHRKKKTRRRNRFHHYHQPHTDVPAPLALISE
jgi:ubiquitin C-terminal hydrolase